MASLLVLIKMHNKGELTNEKIRKNHLQRA